MQTKKYNSTLKKKKKEEAAKDCRFRFTGVYEVKVAVLNDTHCGIRNSSEIFLNNAADFYGNVFFPYCKEHNIKQIIHLG